MNPLPTGNAVFVDQRSRRAIEDEVLAARCNAPVLITSSSACAVEKVARRVHRASVRAASPFLQISAREFPVDPVRLRRFCADLVATACGGTLLIDELEHLPPIVQEQLMDLLGELQHPISILGFAAPLRLITGTTAALGDLLSGGAFSDRLFYRLNVIHLVVRPPAPKWSATYERAGGRASPPAMQRPDR
jgi:DNA-binding NtrC family response regulator